MPDNKDMQRLQEQSAMFNKLAASKQISGKGKPIPQGTTMGNYTVNKVDPTNSNYSWIKKDSSQVTPADSADFVNNFTSKLTGKHDLMSYEKEPPPPPKLQDSVFAKLTPQSVMNMPQTKLRGQIVCSEKGGCVVHDSFDMSGKSINSKGHTGKEMVDVNKAHFTTYPQQGPNKMATPTREGAENAWNAGEDVTNELNKQAMAGDTAGVRKKLEAIEGFKKDGNYFKTEMRRDTIPEQAQYIGQQEMNDMRNQGLDVSSYKGYANKDEAKKTSMYNPVREKAFSAFEQKLQNSLRKKP